MTVGVSGGSLTTTGTVGEVGTVGGAGTTVGVCAGLLAVGRAVGGLGGNATIVVALALGTTVDVVMGVSALSSARGLISVGLPSSQAAMVHITRRKRDSNRPDCLSILRTSLMRHDPVLHQLVDHSHPG